MEEKRGQGRPKKLLVCAYCGVGVKTRDALVHQIGCREEHGGCPVWERGVVGTGLGNKEDGGGVRKRASAVKVVRQEAAGQVIEKIFD